MIKLFPYQKLAVNFAVNKENIFIEAPTGSGKSVIISYLARYYINQGKKVIVSTNTNQLALQLLENIEKLEFENPELNNNPVVDIVVGKNNYLDLEKIDLENFAKFIDVKDVIKELSKLENSNSNKDYLIDIFLDKLDIDEASKEILSKILQTNKDKDLKSFNDVDIAVTNHYYLIYKILFTKEDLKDYVFILDEAHQIAEAMEAIYTKNFSLFRYKYLLDKLINDIKFLDFKGKKTTLKKLFSLQTTTYDLLKKTVKENIAGFFFLKDEKHMKIINMLIRHLTKEDFLKLKQKLQKISLPTEQAKIKNLFIEEWEELIEISKTPLKDIGIYYSPSKGYPRLSITKKEFFIALREFWNKIDNIKAFSATLTIPNDDEYYKKRLNIGKDKKITYYQIPPVFKKEQINYTIIDNSFPKPNSSEDYVDIEWIKAIGDYILKTYEEKNSLVLMGSFLEVDTLFEYFNTCDIPVPVLKAERKKSAYRIVEKFKKENGILIATRNYGVGIDLKEELLEKLYITKLPYPVMGNKKWLELKAQDKLKGTNLSYFLSVNEMLLNLKQWIGRLIRSPKDKGDLYLLDSRINKNNLYSRIVNLINNMYQ